MGDFRFLSSITEIICCKDTANQWLRKTKNQSLGGINGQYAAIDGGGDILREGVMQEISTPPHFLQLLRKKQCRLISLAASGDYEKNIINAETHHMLHRDFCFHLAFKFFNSVFGQMICSYLN